MKKQILTLTMCLALTSTVALANGVKTVTQKPTIQKAAVPAPSAKTPDVKAPTASLVPSLTKPGEQLQMMNREEAKKHFENIMAQKRELFYTALNLSAEQKTKAEELDAKTRAGAGKVIRNVQLEARKLRDLQSKHASVFAIWRQKLALKSAKAEKEKYFKSSKKEFEAILTKEQKAKFELIDDAKRKEMEKFKKEHKHGGPKLIGPNGPQHYKPVGPPPPPEDKK